MTAAATGAIAGSVIVLGRRTVGNPLSDPVPAILALITAVVLWKTKKVPEPIIVLVAAAIGLIVYQLMHR